MAYNKRNFYTRVLEIQNLTKELQKLGSTNVYIFNNFVKNHYHISKRTFDEYLGIPAERELKKLAEISKQQPKLFDD